MKKISLLMIALAATSSQAMAGSATANFQVSATVNASCLVSASNVDFGPVTPAGTGTATATGSITSTCSKTTPYSLAISAGSSGSVSDRKMAGSISGNTDTLAYNLYSDSGATKVWGETAGTNTVDLTGTGVAQTSTIYGKLPLNQYIKPDSYKDNLTVTLTY